MLTALLAVAHSERLYDLMVVGMLRRRYHPHATPTNVPGFLFLEIDGLAEPILRQALAAGAMPTLQRWLTTGSHRLLRWEPDLSSQTSASQAGILLGDNTDIPAFRWYDKATGSLMVSSRLQTARVLEERLANGHGLLARAGGARWDVFSGDAPDCLCVYSTVGDRARTVSDGYLAEFLDPFPLTRALVRFAEDVLRERWQAWRQIRRNEQPRIHRKFTYAFIRAATTTLMQEATQLMLLGDLFRGMPAVYATFFGYDEVAHHSGIDRPDAFKVLTTLDRVFARLELAARSAPRPYHLVVLSDHGQSMGATFRQRYGQTLGELVDSLLPEEQQVASDADHNEHWGQVNAGISEALAPNRWVPNMVRKGLGRHGRSRQVTLGPDRHEKHAAKEREMIQSDAVVLASGNLGLISFPQWSDRLTYEQITESFPPLVPGLSQHPGISCLLVHSNECGGMVIGANGTRYLDSDRVEGEDPLAGFEPSAARHLKRTDIFANAADIMVISQYDPTTQEDAAFEELIGNHGGLGGPQTQPFVLYPAGFDPGPTPIVGAATLHDALKGWVDQAQAEK